MALNKPHILICIDWFLPGYKAGGPIRSIAHMTEQLPFRFSVITSIFDHNSTEPYPHVTPGEWQKYNANTAVLYLDPSAIDKDIYKQQIQNLNPDFIYCNSLFSPNFALTPIKAAREMGLRDKVVLAPRGMLKSGALKVKAGKKRVFLLLSRWLGWFKGISWHATNEQEASEIKKHYGIKSKIHVAPNLPASLVGQVELTERKETLKLVTVARVSQEKNILGAAQILIEQEGPVEWHVFGVLQDQAYFREVQSVCSKKVDLNVTFHGDIPPTEIDRSLKKGHFFFLPTLGENYGHAIVEAFVRGIPVITSDKTPWRNLSDFGCGWDIPLDGNWKDAIAKAKNMDQESYAEMRSKALAYAQIHVHSNEAIQSYRAIFAES